MNKRFLSILYTLSLCVVVTACSAKTNTENNVSDSTTNSQTEIAVKESESIGDIETYIKLSDDNTVVEGSGVNVENNIITITDAGYK